MIALADNGSFVMASAGSGLSPSAICRAVHDLEQLVGSPFSERRGRGVAITDVGLRATSAFRVAVATLRSALDEIAIVNARSVVEPEPRAVSASGSRLAPSGKRDFTRYVRTPDGFGVTVQRRSGWHAPQSERCAPDRMMHVGIV